MAALNQIPNPAAIETWYRKKLVTMVKAMRKSVEYWAAAKYKQQETRIVSDASPGMTLWEELDSMFAANISKFDDMAKSIAANFADKTQRHSINNLLGQLNAAGFALKPKVPRSVQTRATALMLQNAELIKSIPRQYMTAVSGAVQRGVLDGRNLKSVMDAITKTGAVTERRARMITRDQTNKGTQAMARAVSESVGVTKGIWQHNAGGKSVREEHVKFHGREFDLNKGLWDDKEQAFVLPGELISCNCTYKPVLPEAVSWK